MSDAQTLEDDGFVVLRDLIDDATLADIWEHAADLLTFYRTPAQRSGLSIAMQLSELHDASKDALYRWCLAVARTPPVLRLFDHPRVQGLRFGTFPMSRQYLVDPCAFFNRRDVTRLQYDWHVESAYYPNASEVLTLWFPFLHSVNEENGTMVMAAGSHRAAFAHTIVPVPGGLDQARIDPALLADYQKVPMNLALGDAVMFSARTAHATGKNRTAVPRLSMLFRISDNAAALDGGWRRP